MTIWIATSNKGKLGEFKLLLERELPGVSIHSLSELPNYYSPPESGKTFFENATIKTKSLFALKSDGWVLGDDSGLECAGLGGLPGIHSARYAGDKASDGENVAKLLKMMQIRGITDRSAQFVCSLVAYGPGGERQEFTGTLKGRIATKPAGQMGFGYDSVFIPDGEKQTLAELGPSYKIKHSHRSKATMAFLTFIDSLRKTL
jgi:XTP/dITP diphosphohydrolase